MVIEYRAWDFVIAANSDIFFKIHQYSYRLN